jgi:Cft2 family RNA processing exonuclease
MAELIVLGGAEEIGANSMYFELEGTGIIIDAGLHPRYRDARAFPELDVLALKPLDILAITHAHTDHLSGLPYVLRRFPHMRTIMTHATRDLSHIMLHNSGRLLKTDISSWFSSSVLEFYSREQIELLRQSFEPIEYAQPLLVRGYSGRADVKITYHWSGHILGSAGIELECGGMRLMHTGDVQFDSQRSIREARFPRTHFDVLVTEATNCATDNTAGTAGELRRLASFINRITSANGSVLIPCFALGKQQEILVILNELMLKGAIPHLPIFTGGMGVKINKVYDQYCYTEPFRRPGFEISDIPQEQLRFEELFTSRYMKHPSIVVAPSGMMNKGTLSFALSTQWITKPNFGIAFVGYQDPETPGSQLLNSQPNVAFELAGRTVKRSCQIERVRFSAHASLGSIVDYITDVRPNTLVIVHGETDACEMLALCVRERLPKTRIVIPAQGVAYDVSLPANDNGFDANVTTSAVKSNEIQPR